MHAYVAWRFSDRERGMCSGADPRRQSTKGAQMPLLWILVVVLIIFAVAGGVAVNNFLWLILVVALILALVSLVSGRRTV
jgi:Flp pilus assembly protein TadB